MAGIRAADFSLKVKQICAESALVVRVVIISESQHQIKMRILLKDRSSISVYYNDENGKTGFAQLRNNLRVFGADNAVNWHWHPREDPAQHVASEHEISFEEFMAEIEKLVK